MELLHFNVILMASNKHSVDGFFSDLVLRASLQASRPSLLSVLGYMSSMSHHTNKTSSDMGAYLVLRRLTKLRKSVVSTKMCSCERASGPGNFSVKADKWIVAELDPAVITLNLQPGLCVLTRP